MLYPYQQERDYTKEVALVFGILSILFAFIIPPTGLIMGIVGFFFERKSAKKRAYSYSHLNLGLNSAGVIIGTLMIFYFLIFKMGLLR
ncbi:DUF4190 domain-containing protein [Candidatus Woesearchaeota archaeon]|nr:DUF4190 domain-containing protein [Candidatus Woesearchaeota archaeon]